jgi:hypothetical protein
MLVGRGGADIHRQPDDSYACLKNNGIRLKIVLPNYAASKPRPHGGVAIHSLKNGAYGAS